MLSPSLSMRTPPLCCPLAATAPVAPQLDLGHYGYMLIIFAIAHICVGELSKSFGIVNKRGHFFRLECRRRVTPTVDWDVLSGGIDDAEGFLSDLTATGVTSQPLQPLFCNNRNHDEGGNGVCPPQARDGIQQQ